MRPVLKITRQFDTDHPEREMNRLINGLYDYAGQVAQAGEVRPEMAGIVRTGTTSVGFDVLLRVSPANESTVVVVQLPQPRTEDGGRVCRVARTTAGGEVLIQAVGGATLNGGTRLFMYNAPGLAEVRFDGQNYWTTYYGALSWAEAF